MLIHQQGVDAVFRSLDSSPRGLEEAEAARRLACFGPNAVARVRAEPLARQLLRELSHLLAVVLWLAAALAFIAGWSDPASSMVTLGFAIVLVILVNGGFSFWQQRRAARAIECLEQLLPSQVMAVRGGGAREVHIHELVPGDVIVVAGGDLVPADCRVIESFAQRVNRATLSGESLPVALEAGPTTEGDNREARNVLLAGTSVVAGDGRAVVFATGGQTEFARIAALAQAVPAELSPLQREIMHLTRVIGAFSLGLGLLFFVVGQVIDLPLWQSLLFGVGILVANVPEGLLPTVTLALAMASQRMARRRALVRNLPAVETLGAATVICTDKTGTLTENRMKVRALYLGGVLHDLAGTSLTQLAAQHPRFFAACLYCENVQQQRGERAHELLGDPMEIALVQLARHAVPELAEQPRLDEVPFDSERRRLSTLHRTTSGYIVYSKGALEALLPTCTHAIGAAGIQPLDVALRRELLETERDLAGRGLRMLAVACRELQHAPPRERFEEDLIFLGLVALEDPPRIEVPEAVRRCREAGVRIIMVTGDHPATALAVARQVGIAGNAGAGRVVTGAEIAQLADAELSLLLDAPGLVLARVGAAEKCRIVERLRARGEVVAVTGDGVNDAAALRAADIGIAMGVTGTAVAREAADIVLADDNFATIVQAIEEGRAAYSNIRKFLTYILTSNVPEIVPYIAFVLAKIPLPLTVLQILAVDLGTDIVPALALGAEPADPRLMRSPPRPRTERLLAPGLLWRAYGWLGLFEAAAGMGAFFLVLNQGGWVYGEALPAGDPLYREATTACLAAIVIMQVVNVFICRSDRRSVLDTGLGGNRLLLAGIGVEIGLMMAITYAAPGQALFGTAPLALDAWLVALPFAAAMLLAEELRKALVRRRS